MHISENYGFFVFSFSNTASHPILIAVGHRGSSLTFFFKSLKYLILSMTVWWFVLNKPLRFLMYYRTWWQNWIFHVYKSTICIINSLLLQNKLGWMTKAHLSHHTPNIPPSPAHTQSFSHTACQMDTEALLLNIN